MAFDRGDGRRVRVLVTNDDGIDAPGLAALAEGARDAGLDVVVAAPVAQASGSSASITAVTRDGHTPVEPRELPTLPGIPAYAVDAQPGFIVRAAIGGWFSQPPQLVLSGINEGTNVGRAVLHSGTVGAALTAGLRSVRALAVSLEMPPDGAPPRWSSAVHVLPAALELLLEAEPVTVLSLNVPNRPVDGLGELREATLASFGAVQSHVEVVDGGHLQARVGQTKPELEAGTDRALLAAGHPTITALESVREQSLERGSPRVDGAARTRWAHARSDPR